jgi:AAA domain-containing protein
MSSTATQPTSKLARPNRIIDTQYKTFNALVYGLPGVGKTLLGATGPGPVLFVDIDQGLRSISNLDAGLAQELGINLQELYSEQARGLVSIMGLFRRLEQEFTQDPARYGTVVLDNLTELQRCLMREHLTRAQQRENRSYTNAGVQDHGVVLNQMQNIVMAFKALPTNVLFITHEAVRDNYIGPALTGQMREELPGYVDAVLRYTLISQETVDQATGEKLTKVVRFLRTRPMPPSGEERGIIAKHRGDRLQEREYPHLAKIIDRINAKGG